MPTFRSYDNLGKTGATVSIHVYVYFDDPEREGNCGGQGFDDDGLSRTCPNAGLARAWAPKLAEQARAKWPGCHVSEGKVEVFRWIDCSFTDDGQRWFDAEQSTEQEQYGYPQDDGTWKWDALERPRRW